jgi:hypothetical protein
VCVCLCALEYVQDGRFDADCAREGGFCRAYCYTHTLFRLTLKVHTRRQEIIRLRDAPEVRAYKHIHTHTFGRLTLEVHTRRQEIIRLRDALEVRANDVEEALRERRRCQEGCALMRLMWSESARQEKERVKTLQNHVHDLERLVEDRDAALDECRREVHALQRRAACDLNSRSERMYSTDTYNNQINKCASVYGTHAGTALAQVCPSDSDKVLEILRRQNSAHEERIRGLELQVRDKHAVLEGLLLTMREKEERWRERECEQEVILGKKRIDDACMNSAVQRRCGTDASAAKSDDTHMGSVVSRHHEHRYETALGMDGSGAKSDDTHMSSGVSRHRHTEHRCETALGEDGAITSPTDVMPRSGSGGSGAVPCSIQDTKKQSPKDENTHEQTLGELNVNMVKAQAGIELDTCTQSLNTHAVGPAFEASKAAFEASKAPGMHVDSRQYALSSDTDTAEYCAQTDSRKHAHVTLTIHDCNSDSEQRQHFTHTQPESSNQPTPKCVSVRAKSEETSNDFAPESTHGGNNKLPTHKDDASPFTMRNDGEPCVHPRSDVSSPLTATTTNGEPPHDQDAASMNKWAGAHTHKRVPYMGHTRTDQLVRGVEEEWSLLRRTPARVRAREKDFLLGIMRSMNVGPRECVEEGEYDAATLGVDVYDDEGHRGDGDTFHIRAEQGHRGETFHIRAEPMEGNTFPITAEGSTMDGYGVELTEGEGDLCPGMMRLVDRDNDDSQGGRCGRGDGWGMYADADNMCPGMMRLVDREVRDSDDSLEERGGRRGVGGMYDGDGVCHVAHTGMASHDGGVVHREYEARVRGYAEDMQSDSDTCAHKCVEVWDGARGAKYHRHAWARAHMHVSGNEIRDAQNSSQTQTQTQTQTHGQGRANHGVYGVRVKTTRAYAKCHKESCAKGGNKVNVHTHSSREPKYVGIHMHANSENLMRNSAATACDKSRGSVAVPRACADPLKNVSNNNNNNSNCNSNNRADDLKLRGGVCADAGKVLVRTSIERLSGHGHVLAGAGAGAGKALMRSSVERLSGHAHVVAGAHAHASFICPTTKPLSDPTTNTGGRALMRTSVERLNKRVANALSGHAHGVAGAVAGRSARSSAENLSDDMDVNVLLLRAKELASLGRKALGQQ